MAAKSGFETQQNRLITFSWMNLIKRDLWKQLQFDFVFVNKNKSISGFEFSPVLVTL